MKLAKQQFKLANYVLKLKKAKQMLKLAKL